MADSFVTNGGFQLTGSDDFLSQTDFIINRGVPTVPLDVKIENVYMRLATGIHKNCRFLFDQKFSQSSKNSMF